MKETIPENNNQVDTSVFSVSRRKFLTYAGGITGAVVLLDACKKDDNNSNTTTDNGISLGTGDLALLNYAYALEQLEAAFYVQVLTTPYKGIIGLETVLLTDIRDHEIAHREFFKNFLAEKAIPNLTFDFSSIDFTSRTSVLNAAVTFEDLGVTAYNGAAQLFVTPGNVLIAGKIVSVEARHAALLRDLVSWGSFSATTDHNGLDTGNSPQAILPIVQKYIVTKLSATGLPTN